MSRHTHLSRPSRPPPRLIEAATFPKVVSKLGEDSSSWKQNFSFSKGKEQPCPWEKTNILPLATPLPRNKRSRRLRDQTWVTFGKHLARTIFALQKCAKPSLLFLQQDRKPAQSITSPCQQRLQPALVAFAVAVQERQDVSFRHGCPQQPGSNQPLSLICTDKTHLA